MIDFIRSRTENKEELDNIFDAKHRFASLCRDGDLQRIRIAYDWIGNDPRKLFNSFCAACLTGQRDVINFFFEEKGFKLSSYENRNLALYYACHVDDVELIKLLISKASFSKEHIAQAFGFAITNCNFNVADFYLELGINSNNSLFHIFYPEREVKFLSIHDAKQEADLVEYLLDNDKVVRYYAEHKLKRLDK